MPSYWDAPENFNVAGTALESLHEPKVAAGLPSDLLRRRPDVFTAEANLESASADLVAARAALFPSLTLTASGGVQNPALNAAVITLSGVGPTLNLGAALAQPIFDGGRLRAAPAQAQAKQQEVAASYRAAIVAALVDVENSLSAIHHLDAAREFQKESRNRASALSKALDFATKRAMEIFFRCWRRKEPSTRCAISSFSTDLPGCRPWSASARRWAAVGKRRTPRATPH